MKDLSLPLKKKKKLVVGLMSGTSLDSVDAVLVEIKNSGIKSRIIQKDFISFPFPAGAKEYILNNSNPNSGNVTDICRLNFLISYIYIAAVDKLLAKNKLNYADIDLIGSHGQTIHHLPDKEEIFGYTFGSTLQIGDPAVIAKRTGILTVGDFRTGDVALGGEGAPLVPYFDYVLFNSKSRNIALLNIGGISNITYLRKKSLPQDTIAFDTGPGNMMIDLVCRRYFKTEYDKGGKLASSGKLNNVLFERMIEEDNFINKVPPKSTGREYYGDLFLDKVLDESLSTLKKEDIIATVTEFTAYAIYKNFDLHIKELPDELYVSGGGSSNKFLMKRISTYMGKKTKIKKVDSAGITSDAKEAVCFAFLANETVSYNPGNIPNVTGALRPAILGKICLP
jgi:anhydro-N-acetylmuramic acid kinase